MYKARREELVARNESHYFCNKKEVGDAAAIGSAGELLSSDESSSTTSVSHSSDAEDLHNAPYLVEENDAPMKSRDKSSSSSFSSSEFAHVRCGRKVVLVKWKEA